ncbi:MAG: hypothetical protein JJ908_05905 [Rhizobiales bacterium]|nr:hypothetical protein [Hyphomicrobiales bacterium]MBO6697860.1 hypothetical protein [Hyphomicrobiales bacterium]MBO6735886.1 hypothetical protein [Hyphomicrobiales bacterium]MBO6913897.1 hypothetical protein [Hyphomicrobiales bacterium]MBO6955600.1 hypothetical protein [Hyphomicrobiales bacterium]
MSQSPQTNWAKSVYFAQPYSLDAIGFYFTSPEEYRNCVDDNRNALGRPIEEYELQYIDGERQAFFSALRINQANLGDWFDLLDALGNDQDRYLVACHLAEYGYEMDQLADHWDDHYVYRGSIADYAEDLIRDCEDLPDRITASSIISDWGVTSHTKVGFMRSSQSC